MVATGSAPAACGPDLGLEEVTTVAVATVALAAAAVVLVMVVAMMAVGVVVRVTVVAAIDCLHRRCLRRRLHRRLHLILRTGKSPLRVRCTFVNKTFTRPRVRRAPSALVQMMSYWTFHTRPSSGSYVRMLKTCRPSSSL